MAENVQDSRLNRAVQETSKYNHMKKKSYCKNDKQHFQLKRQQQLLMTRQKKRDK